MKITYDPAEDVLRILFSNAPIEESDEEKPGVVLDYEKHRGRCVSGCKTIDRPRLTGVIRQPRTQRPLVT